MTRVPRCGGKARVGLSFLIFSLFYLHLQYVGVPSPKGPKIEKNQSRLKFSISLESFQSRLKTFNPDIHPEFPTKKGFGGWLA